MYRERRVIGLQVYWFTSPFVMGSWRVGKSKRYEGTMSDDLKFDGGKLRLDLVPTEAMTALAQILTDGAQKYGARSWERGMEWSRVYAALQRHLIAWWSGQDIDTESGHPHLWHVLTNAAFLAAYESRGVGIDNRQGKVNANGL